MTERTQIEIEAEQLAKEKLLRSSDDALSVVLAEVYALDRQITDLENKKAELREAARKSRHFLRGLRLDLDQLKNEWFRARERGRGGL